MELYKVGFFVISYFIIEIKTCRFIKISCHTRTYILYVRERAIYHINVVKYKENSAAIGTGEKEVSKKCSSPVVE
jgi:hypothetical protein